MPPSKPKGNGHKCACSHTYTQHSKKGVCIESGCFCNEYLPSRIQNLLSQKGKLNNLSRALTKRGKLDVEFSRYVKKAIRDAAMPFVASEWNSNRWIQEMVLLQHERVCATIVQVLTGGKRG